MTTLLDKAIAKVRELPDADQDLAAEVMLAVVHRNDTRSSLTPGQIDIVRRTRTGVENGTVRLVPESEMEEFWRSLKQ